MWDGYLEEKVEAIKIDSRIRPYLVGAAVAMSVALWIVFSLLKG